MGEDLSDNFLVFYLLIYGVSDVSSDVPLSKQVISGAICFLAGVSLYSRMPAAMPSGAVASMLFAQIPLLLKEVSHLAKK